MVLELCLTKDRILDLYLNMAEWGDGVFGAEVAAWTHYRKSARSLSREEAARLAAILPVASSVAALRLRRQPPHGNHPRPHGLRRAEGVQRSLGSRCPILTQAPAKKSKALTAEDAEVRGRIATARRLLRGSRTRDRPRFRVFSPQPVASVLVATRDALAFHRSRARIRFAA